MGWKSKGNWFQGVAISGKQWREQCRVLEFFRGEGERGGRLSLQCCLIVTQCHKKCSEQAVQFHNTDYAYQFSFIN